MTGREFIGQNFQRILHFLIRLFALHPSPSLSNAILFELFVAQRLDFLSFLIYLFAPPSDASTRSASVVYTALDAARLQSLSIRQFHQSLLCHHGFFFAALWTFHGATPRLAQLPHLPLRASVRRLYATQHPSSTLRSTLPAFNPSLVTDKSRHASQRLEDHLSI